LFPLPLLLLPALRVLPLLLLLLPALRVLPLLLLLLGGSVAIVARSESEGRA
jgi:hypothetical protein